MTAKTANHTYGSPYAKLQHRSRLEFCQSVHWDNFTCSPTGAPFMPESVKELLFSIYIMLKILKYLHRYVFLAGTLSYSVIEDSGHRVTVRQQGFDGNIVITCGA